LGTLANAASQSIFDYAESDPSNTGAVIATAGSTSTALTTFSVPNPGFIPIAVTREGNVSGLNIAALEQFVGVVTTGPATSSAAGVSQPVMGMINFFVSAGPGPVPGPLIFSITFQNAVLEGSGNSGDIRGSQPGTGIVTLNTGPAGGAIAAAVGLPIGTPFSGAFSNSLVGATPAFTITASGTIGSFSANVTGNASPNVIPEPASIVLSGTAVLAGLGVFALRRRSASKA